MKVKSEKIKFPYKIPIIIFASMIVFHVVLESQSPTDELYILTGIIIVVTTLVVSISCFIVSKIYGYSRIFGMSYLILGVGYFFAFLGELSFVYLVDILNQDSSPIIGEVSFLIFYLLVIGHAAINIRYFADHLLYYQKILLVTIPVVMVLAYSYLVFNTGNVDYSEIPFSLVAVSLSALTVSFVVIGFTLFKQTALMTAWFLLLIGLVIGNIGDIANYYLVTVAGDFDALSNYSPTLWITSNAVMIYALYRHQKTV